MPYHDPISTITGNWDTDTGTPHHEQVDDAVRQPSDPGTSTKIENSFMGGDAVEEHGYTASSPNEITEAVVWVNIDNQGPGSSTDVALKIGGSYTSNQNVSGVSPRAWTSKTFNATSDPSLFPISAGTAINGRFTAHGAGPGTGNHVYEHYLDATESAGGGGNSHRNLLLLGIG